jgi:hypothetical protein
MAARSAEARLVPAGLPLASGRGAALQPSLLVLLDLSYGQQVR